jgi:hypothetical protein
MEPYWGFPWVPNKKVPLNTDLLKHRTAIFIQNTSGELKLNEITVWLKVELILGEV